MRSIAAPRSTEPASPLRASCGRRIRLIALGFLVFASAVTGASLGARSVGGDAGSLSQRLQALAQEKSRVRQRLRGVKQRQRQISRQLSRLDARLEQTEQRLDRVTAEADSTQAHLQLATQQYHAAVIRLSDQKDSVSERLVAIYQRGEVKPLEVLLQSSSFSDFTNRLYLLNQLVARDAEILDDYHAAQHEAEVRRAELDARHQELTALQGQIAREKKRTAVQREDTAREKRSVLRDRLIYERALAELEQDSREIEQMLRRLQLTSAGQQRLAKPWTGTLHMPVKGRMTSPYGYRIHPIYKVRKLHTGIDIAAPSGTAIKAAGDGLVVFAGRWGGYGNCVILDHGGGTATLYGHCSRLAVANGGKVTQGQTIAYVGSTGLSTGPHLHFEVRRDGHPVDPMGYL
jgi:murein DD-endopeptidase MepM/ murein hydrolase activator NlpD